MWTDLQATFSKKNLQRSCQKVLTWINKCYLEMRHGFLASLSIHFSHTQTFKDLTLCFGFLVYSILCLLIFDEWLSLFIWPVIELTNIIIHLNRLTVEPVFVRIAISRILMWFSVYNDIDELAEYLYFPLNLAVYSLFASYYIFDLDLALQKKDLSFRLSYFRDRFIYYIGYGLPCGLCYYFDYPVLFLICMFMALHSTEVLESDAKAPKYERWLPSKKEKYPNDFESILETGLLSVFGFAGQQIERTPLGAQVITRIKQMWIEAKPESESKAENLKQVVVDALTDSKDKAEWTSYWSVHKYKITFQM